jgi:dTDP-glucose 4,6-dehydratase
MRVLVTGGAGFIGSHFVRRLAAGGNDVVVLDKLTYSGNRANLADVDHEFVQGDIADADAVAEAAAGVDAIVNFAAETHVDRSILSPEQVIRTNVLGPHVLLEWARESGKRLLHVSTDEVYGDVGLDEPARVETDQLRPSSPYSAAKAGGDLLVPAYVRTYGVDALRTHGANTYGSHQYPEKFLPLFVTNLLDGEPVPVYGDGRQRREWLHVEDHVAALELLLHEGRPGEAYNIGGEEQENLAMVARFLERTGADPGLVRHVEDRAGHDRRYAVDDAKLRSLGWTRRVPLDEGVASAVAWYRDNRAWWEPIKSGEFRAYYEQQYAARFVGEPMVPPRAPSFGA